MSIVIDSPRDGALDAVYATHTLLEEGTMVGNLLDIVVAGYRNGTEAAWEARVIEAASALDHGFGVFMSTVARRQDGTTVSERECNEASAYL